MARWFWCYCVIQCIQNDFFSNIRFRFFTHVFFSLNNLFVEFNSICGFIYQIRHIHKVLRLQGIFYSSHNMCIAHELKSNHFHSWWNLQTKIGIFRLFRYHKKEVLNDRRHDANCGLFKYAHLNKNHPIPKRFFKNVMHDEFICFGLRLWLFRQQNHTLYLSSAHLFARYYFFFFLIRLNHYDTQNKVEISSIIILPVATHTDNTKTPA